MKKIIAIALLLSCSLVFGGCFFPFGVSDEFANGIEWVFNEISRYADEQSDLSSEQSETQNDDTSNESILESRPEEFVSEDESIIIDESETRIDEIDNLIEFRDYINEKKENGILETEFIYNGNTSELNGQEIARISTSCCVTTSISGNHYRVRLYEYPGDRIADAYRNNDTSKLNNDELETLKVAKRMLYEIKDEAKNDFELELMIHDAIVNKVSYYDGTIEVDDVLNPPRHLTAVGALLDGKANCQGYTDAFYLLATMAGFDVGRMSVETSDALHIVNTIKLQDEWYIVDTTFNDTATIDDGSPDFYYLFNAGKDMSLFYSWDEHFEYNPISEISNGNYFYFYTDKAIDCGYEKAYIDVNAMAKAMIEEWYYDDTDTVHGLLLDRVCDWTALSDALNSVDTPDSIVFSYSVWTYDNGRDTYFIVEFDD